MSAGSESKISSKELERFINKIKGVLSSKVELTSHGDIESIYILSDLIHSPNQVIRDIQNSISAVYGFAPQENLISISQVDQSAVGVSGVSGVSGAAVSQDLRLQITNLILTTEANILSARVTVCYDGITYEGLSSGTNTHSSRPRIIVNSLLSAIHSFLSYEAVFTLIDIQKIKFANRDTYITAIVFLNEYGDELLTGISIIRDDENYAILRSALDAVNRRLVHIYNQKNLN